MKLCKLAACTLVVVGCSSRAHPPDTSASDAGAPSVTGAEADAGSPAADGGPGSASSGSCPSLAPPAGLCDDTWCWDYPAPFGYDLTAIAPGIGDDLWVAGQSIIARRSHGVWAMWPAPGDITKLWVSPAGIVFALVRLRVFQYGVFQFDGQKWTSLLDGARDVAFVDATTAYALSDASILRWDGKQWTVAFTPAAWMQSIVATSAAEVWGTSGTVFVHFDGNTWTEAPHGFATQVSTGLGQWTTAPVDLSQLFVDQDGDVWAAGNCGGIAVHDASGWNLVGAPQCGWRSQGHEEVVGIVGTRNDAWFALRYVSYYPDAVAYGFRRGLGGDATYADVDRSINAIAATPSGPQAVGSFGTLWKQEGESWKREMGGGGAISALAVDDCGRGLAAAFVPPSMWTRSSQFLRNDGAGWSVDADGVGAISTIVAPGFNDAWASYMFYDSPLLHRDATGWTAVADLAADQFINAVSASAGDDVWALGRDLWHFDGRTWQGPFALGQLHFVWTRAPDDAWALKMGDRADVSGLWHWNGIAWSPVAGPPTFAAALSGDSKGPWIAGVDTPYPPQPTHAPTLFHFADGAWTAVALPEWAVGSVGSLQVTADGNVYIGASGMPPNQMLRWDGASFTTMKGGAVASDRAGHLWLGTGGGILRHR